MTFQQELREILIRFFNSTITLDQAQTTITAAVERLIGEDRPLVHQKTFESGIAEGAAVTAVNMKLAELRSKLTSASTDEEV